MLHDNPTISIKGGPDVTNFFGIPRYHQPGVHRFDYEQKYPPDPEGEEASDEARVWATYLDEAEAYDHDMIQGFRDTIDSLLVLAGLFSAIIATFVAQTSQSLKPNFSQLNLLVQIEQTALLRTGGNISAMNIVPSSGITAQTPTFTTADLWINGLFFTSLSISVATALLAALAKQWCQVRFYVDSSVTRLTTLLAYTSVTSGSARYKVLSRQFRFDGLIKWKLPEIVGSLPLLLHTAFAVFFAGLSFFVYDLHQTLSSSVIFIAITVAILYFGALVLPAIWLECPFRIPLFFRPTRTLIYFLGTFANLTRSKEIGPLFTVLRPYLPPKRPKKEDIVTSLKQAEELLLRIPHSRLDKNLSPSMLILAHSLEWLFTLSENKATQRIVTAALYGCFKEHWGLAMDETLLDWFPRRPPLSLILFLKATPWRSMAEIAFENATAPINTPAPPANPVKSSTKTWTGIIDVLMKFSQTPDKPLPTPISQDVVNERFMHLIMQPYMHHNLRDTLLRWGADVHKVTWYDGPLHAAVEAGNLENLQWLIECGVPVDEPVSLLNGTPLLRACDLGFAAAVKLLVAQGADVSTARRALNFDSGLWITPLRASITRKRDIKIIALLLDAGARLNTPFSDEGDTALQAAAEAGFSAAVGLLLQRGAMLTPRIRKTLSKLEWIGGSDLERAAIEGMLREYASQTIASRCLPVTRFGSALSRNFLA